MKPTGVRRGISSHHARSAGDAPKLGRVSRLRDPDGLARGAGAGDCAATRLARRKTILGWSLFLTITTVLVVGGFMVVWMRGHGYGGAGPAKSQGLQNVRVLSKFPSPDEGKALGLVKRALANRDPELVETCFRLGEATPAEVVDFVKQSEVRDGRIEQFCWLGSMDVEGQLLEGVLVIYAGKERPGERLAFLVPDEKGVWKVDFDAFARTSRPSFRDFMGGRADHSQVRVLTAKDSYHNGPFLDESRWVCYSMSSPETREVMTEERELLRGYCRVGSPQAKAMERIIAAGGTMSRATLEIRRREGADPRQFEIARVLSEDWVLTAMPFDKRFE